MSARPGVLVTIRRPADGGESPHQTVASITAEVRVFWPPTAPAEDVIQAIRDAADQALQEFDAWRSK